jgi:hypothetical protein
MTSQSTPAANIGTVGTAMAPPPTPTSVKSGTHPGAGVYAQQNYFPERERPPEIPWKDWEKVRPCPCLREGRRPLHSGMLIFGFIKRSSSLPKCSRANPAPRSSSTSSDTSTYSLNGTRSHFLQVSSPPHLHYEAYTDPSPSRPHPRIRQTSLRRHQWQTTINPNDHSCRPAAATPHPARRLRPRPSRRVLPHRPLRRRAPRPGSPRRRGRRQAERGARPRCPDRAAAEEQGARGRRAAVEHGGERAEETQGQAEGEQDEKKGDEVVGGGGYVWRRAGADGRWWDGREFKCGTSERGEEWG